MKEYQKTSYLTLSLKECVAAVLIIVLVSICSYMAGYNAELDKKVTQIEKELADTRTDLDKLIYNSHPKIQKGR